MKMINHPKYDTVRPVTPQTLQLAVTMADVCEAEFCKISDPMMEDLSVSHHAPSRATDGGEAGKPGVVEIILRITPRDWLESAGDLERMLLKIIERRTDSPWRAICPGVYVERIEPYNTIVLRVAVLKTLREQQTLYAQRHAAQCDSNARCGEKSFQLTAELHAPLATVRSAKP